MAFEADWSGLERCWLWLSWRENSREIDPARASLYTLGHPAESRDESTILSPHFTNCIVESDKILSAAVLADRVRNDSFLPVHRQGLACP